MLLTDRRGLIAGLGAIALLPATFRPAAAQAIQSLALTAKAGTIGLRPGAQTTATWVLQGPSPVLRFRRGTQLDIALQNELPMPAALCIRGLDGVPATEPLLATAATAAGGKTRVSLALRQAGLYLCDLLLTGDGASLPTRPLPLVVEESETIPVDRDEVLVIEEWRVRADGTALAPGVDPRDTEVIYTINGVTATDQLMSPLRVNQRLRFRFINASYRSVIAVKLEPLDVRIMAIDSQPAEPFLARNGAVVLAPGGRTDAFIDVTGQQGQQFPMLLHDGNQVRAMAPLVTSEEPPVRPAPLPAAPALPANGLPEQFDLKGALRVNLLLLMQPDWVSPAAFTPSAAPAFRTKRGRTVVLTVVNPADGSTVFHLHGHHFRLLDRLDDGWKPFWLDTLVLMQGQIERIAFVAENPGRFLLESVFGSWAAHRYVWWYEVA